MKPTLTGEFEWNRKCWKTMIRRGVVGKGFPTLKDAQFGQRVPLFREY